jgi:hypothetical protein
VDFPTKAPASTVPTNPFQVTYGGNTDAFVTELNTSGSALVYSSYLGGSGADFGEGIAVDSAGNAYITGSTQSTNFPVVNGLQINNNGSSDAFVTQVNYTGEQILYSTYLGGSQVDAGQSIQLDGSGNAYIAGYTFSSDFLTANPPSSPSFQSLLGGEVGATGADAFVAELNITGTGSKLVMSTFLGGTGDDRAYGLALDGSQSPNIYITGTTVSLFPS